MRRTLIAAVVTGIAALSAAPALSATCVGTANIGRVCSTVSPTGGTLYSDCVYLGGGPCTPVTVPGPTGCITGGGPNWAIVPRCI